MPTLEQAQSWYAADPVHGFDHILRVYQTAERLAQAEGADLEIVRAAALLHDVEESHASGERATHHHRSADFAAQVLRGEGWPEDRIAAVQHCIRAHRFRNTGEAPQTMEAKVLFDADKLDVCGAIGVARTLAYALQANAPFYSRPSQIFLTTGKTEPGESHSAYHEYLFKLRHVKDRLFTDSGRALAEGRHRALCAFFEQLADEMEGRA
jgi:uncharacterized protein